MDSDAFWAGAGTCFLVSLVLLIVCQGCIGHGIEANFKEAQKLGLARRVAEVGKSERWEFITPPPCTCRPAAK